MEGFPQDGVIGQTNPQQALMQEQQRIINEFLGTFRNIGLLDAGSTRGIVNGHLTSIASVVANTNGMKMLADKMSKAREKSEDRIALSSDEVRQIENDLEQANLSKNVWLSVLTTLQFGIIPDQSGDVEYTILW